MPLLALSALAGSQLSLETHFPLVQCRLFREMFRRLGLGAERLLLTDSFLNLCNVLKLFGPFDDGLLGLAGQGLLVRAVLLLLGDGRRCRGRLCRR